MGINDLQTYILSSNSIAVHCNIRQEVRDWRRDHDGASPTIIIDMKEFINILPRIFTNSFSSGGEFDRYNEAATYFLAELKALGVDLVFFVQEKHFDSLEKTRARLADESSKIFIPTHPAARVERGNKRMAYNINKIAQKYGQLRVLTDRQTMAIVNYAAQHEDKVLAIIGKDTDFLVYDGKYQYWTVSEWPTERTCPGLVATRFDRDALLADIRLFNEQFRLLAALSDALGSWAIFAVPDVHLTYPQLLRRAIEYVREQRLTFTDTFDWETIARDLYGPNGYTPEQVAEFEKRYDAFGQITDCEKVDDFYDRLGPETVEVWKFCEENHFFMFRTVIGCGDRVYWLKDLCCLKEDCRRIEFSEAILTVHTKFCGILHNDESEERRPDTKRLFNSYLVDRGGDIECRSVIYPPGTITITPAHILEVLAHLSRVYLVISDLNITLKQLIMEEDNKAYDDQRWNLLQWMLDMSDGFLAAIRAKPNAQKIFVVLITLHFLLTKKFTSPDIAKCILRSEWNFKKSFKAYVPVRFSIPPNIVRRPTNKKFNPYRHHAHRYSITYMMVCQALEVCGLRKETDHITFNAFDFYDGLEPGQVIRKSEFEDILFPEGAI